jgi:hypothetical protein
MLRHARIAAAAGLALCAFPARSADPLEPPDLSRFVRWGPIRVRPTLAFSNFGYDDNIFYRTGDAPKEGDYTVRLSPSLSGVALFGDRAFLTFDEKIDYTMYLRFHSEDYVDQIGSARLTFPFRRMGVYVDGALNRTKERPVDVQDLRAEKRENRLGAGVIFRLGWRTDLELGETRSRFTHLDPDFGSVGSTLTLGQLLNRVEEGTQVRARYRIKGETRFTLDASEKTATFDDPSLLRDSRDTRIMPGVDFGQGGRLAGTVRYGYARLDSKTPTLSDFSGGVWDAKVAYRASSATTVQVGGKRQVAFALYFGNQFYLNSSYELRGIHYVSRAIGIEGGVSDGRLTFPNDVRRDRIQSWDAGLRLRLKENELGRRIEYSFRFTRYRQDSNVDSLDQSRSIVGFGAVLGY